MWQYVALFKHAKGTSVEHEALIHTHPQTWLVPAWLEVLMPGIRTADISDASQLSRVAEETFRATYEATNSVEDLNDHCARSFREDIQKEEISNQNMVTLLSEDEGSLVGFAQLCWSKSPGCVSANAPGEIFRFYVDTRWHGRGVAQQLMSASISEMKKRGSDALWLGVWENNPRAISFYQKLGFTAAGYQQFNFGNDPQRDIVMVRSIGRSNPA